MEITNGRISDNVTLDAASLLPSFSFISYLFHFALYLPHAVSLSLLTDLFLFLLLFPSLLQSISTKKKTQSNTSELNTHLHTTHSNLIGPTDIFPEVTVVNENRNKACFDLSDACE